jgi:Fur family ferric uptake transcriptional regulator
MAESHFRHCPVPAHRLPPDQPTADALIRSHGERPTRARTTVLAVLLAQTEAVSHAELEHLLGDGTMDRVTLYRALAWLEEKGFVHRVVGLDRAARFSANAAEDEHHHPHFKCNDCGRVQCLAESAVAVTLKLPRGYRQARAELTITGLCPDCAH